MSAATPRYALVVATRDRSDKIGALLRSILELPTTDFEAVIVDQSSDDATERVLREVVGDDARFRYVRSDEQGLSRARNQAIARSSAPYLVIADDDCIVPADWLEELTRPFEEDDRVGVVFCTVVPVPFDVPGHTPHITFEHERVLRDPREAWRAARTGLPLGAGMAIRRAAYDAAGGFDQLLGAGARFGAAEDSDLSWRLMLLGWSTVHRPSPVIVHDGFRDLEAFRGLVQRDLVGVGGAMSKYLRSGPWRTRLGACAFLLGWILRLGLVEPGRDLLARRKPTGLRRPLLILRGLAKGLRTPMLGQLMFEPPSPFGAAAPEPALERPSS